MVNGQSESWYDLSGRKLEKQLMQKGLYIVNGNKVVIKWEKSQMMKREYTKPTVLVVLVKHRTALLAGSVIGQGGDNMPSAAPEFEEM